MYNTGRLHTEEINKIRILSELPSINSANTCMETEYACPLLYKSNYLLDLYKKQTIITPCKPSVVMDKNQYL